MITGITMGKNFSPFALDVIKTTVLAAMRYKTTVLAAKKERVDGCHDCSAMISLKLIEENENLRREVEELRKKLR